MLFTFKNFKETKKPLWIEVLIFWKYQAHLPIHLYKMTAIFFLCVKSAQNV